jgi:hypothetical protein
MTRRSTDGSARAGYLMHVEVADGVFLQDLGRPRLMGSIA